MLYLCFPTKGIRLILPFPCVSLAISVILDRPIRNDEISTWERGNSTWGGRARGIGTVPVCVSVQERAGGEGRVLAGKGVVGVLFRERDPKVDDGFAFFIVKNGIVNGDCDDEATANAIFMANLSPVGSLNDDTVVPRYDFDTLSDIVEIVLWYLHSGCSKHMTGHRNKLINFVSKFIRMVQFGNGHFAAIIGYGDIQMGNILISRVYYVEGLSHNLFSVSQFCDLDLEVAFRKHTCFVRNLEGVDLLSSSRGSSLYTISMADMMNSSPICLLFKVSKMKSWLWHHRLSHLNFNTINKLAKQGLVKGLPMLKYTKDHLSLACQMGKSKKQSHLHNSKPSTNEKLQMLHMDLCGLIYRWASFYSSTSIDKDAPSLSNSPNIKATNSPINSTNIEPNEEVAEFDSDIFTNQFAPPNISSTESSSRIVDTLNMHTFQEPPIYTNRWTEDHQLVKIIAKEESENYKEAMEESC
nr:copia protein [Tanacetum cinerariifolium]